MFEPENVSYSELSDDLVMVDCGWSKDIYLMDQDSNNLICL